MRCFGQPQLLPLRLYGPCYAVIVINGAYPCCKPRNCVRNLSYPVGIEVGMAGKRADLRTAAEMSTSYAKATVLGGVTFAIISGGVESLSYSINDVRNRGSFSIRFDEPQ